ncbi:MarR family winged helix-turn-helix transcriptional regulator [Streptomyces sp. NPDC059850]|uniref:MarR family winged helix-turn-helix transcriptional regulator n=1 Tax=Streptomyces sp. NPDC059850 TaxID=3346970 RepID=UPI003666A832
MNEHHEQVREEGEDALDRILQQWAESRPDLDPWSMGMMGRLFRATRLVEWGVVEHLDAEGMERWEFDVLATLRRSGPPYALSPKALAATMMIKPPALTHRVDRLVNRGLVDRELDPTNRRRMVISLTQEGFELVDNAVEGHIRNGERLFSALDRTEQEQLSQLMRKLLLSLGDAAPPSAPGR